MRKYYIHKMGGANLMLSSFDLVKQVKKITKESKNNPIIFVVSAFAGVTRILDSIFTAMTQKNIDEIESLFLIFKKTHSHRMRDLKIDDITKVEKLFSEIDYFIHKDHISENKTIDQAYLLTYGEILSSVIFSQYLSRILKKEIELVDARALFISKPHGSSYVEATVELTPTIENINSLFSIKNGKNKVFITQGFISTDDDSGRCSVLGYDGSDLSAAVIALSLVMSKNYVSLIFWKDVLGVLKDLKYHNSIFPVMRLIEYLEYAVTNSVPVRPDSIKIFLNIDKELIKKYLTINIRSSSYLDCLGTILKP